MDGFGGIVLSETSQKKTNVVLYHLNVESKKHKKPKNIAKKPLLSTLITCMIADAIIPKLPLAIAF